MIKENPFTLTFGKQPDKLIARYEATDMIVSTFSAEHAVSQTFLIEGIRGSGKTVLMTTAANQLGGKKDWVVINLNPAMDLLANLALRLEAACNNKSELINKGFNVSATGFGFGVNADEKNTDYVGIIEKAFKKLIKNRKRVLITIDEVLHDNNMKVFASQFQIFVRQDYPIFLLMTGLFENIYEIQNDPALTFLLRSPKIVTGPLSSIQITRQYREIFGLDEQRGSELADLTKGYAFAFQALGVAYFDRGSVGMDAVIMEYEDLLDDFVYKKIWSSLSDNERKIICAISEDEVPVSAICKKTSMKSGTFSRYREKLINKGIAVSENYGHLSLALPRFYEIVSQYR
ncbi:MAG: ATP-binding protein [Lachnospiraceae bacterium]|nr:ATP-binding protein [Lachnospiraceae bacterium]